MTAMERIEGWRSAALSRLYSSDDREHEMMLNRFAIGSIVCFYVGVIMPAADVQRGPIEIGCGVYLVCTVLLLLHVTMRPRASWTRRFCAIVLDTGLLALCLHLGGAQTAPFFPMFLWIILGNGFRFGVFWLRAAAVCSFVGFGIVSLATPYWRENSSLSIGLLTSLFVIPLYCQTLIRKLSSAKLQAEQASAAKSLFLASVSHELRTPLNAVTGMSCLLLASKLTGQQREMTTTIRSAAGSLLSMIDDLLDLSRIEAGRMTVTEASFDLLEVVRESLAIVSVQAREKGLQLSHHISSRTPLHLVGDARHLREILMNLLGNAVKFTQAGSVVVAVDGVETGDGVYRLQFDVIDTGIGIAAAAHCRIFEEFSQADDTIMNSFGGTGLGLAITRRLAGLMGGQITLESRTGIGSTFSVSLPLRSCEVTPVQPAAPTIHVAIADRTELQPMIERLRGLGHTVVVGAPQITDGLSCALRPIGAGPIGLIDPSQLLPPEQTILVAGARGLLGPASCRRGATVLPEDADDMEVARALRIVSVEPGGAEGMAAEDWTADRPAFVLVADDNVINQRVVSMILERAGHTVRSVANGEEALVAITEASQSKPFDLVLMDLNMPVMNGIDATKLYRFESLGMDHLPIVGLTADVTGDVERRCHEAGMDRCLLKPIQPRALLDAVAQLVPAAIKATGSALPAPSPGVTHINSHPGFRPSTMPSVQLSVLDQLSALGGTAFLDELIDEFGADAARLHTVLRPAILTGDTATVSFHAHAMLSAAGNMGALRLQEMCRDLQRMTPGELMSAGKDVLSLLTQELERIDRVLLGARSTPRPAETAQRWSETGD